MSWSFKFARVAGIDLKIHFTFLLFLIWIGFSYFSVGGPAAARQGVLFIVLLFGCVLLHELGHALTAKKFGIATTDITLLPIGGVARLERIPQDPKQELLIAIAGPLVNVAIAILLIFYLGHRAAMSDFQDLNTPRVAMLSKLATVNIGLVLFNLVPAFPDGWRPHLALDPGHANELSARDGDRGVDRPGAGHFLRHPRIFLGIRSSSSLRFSFSWARNRKQRWRAREFFIPDSS